MSAPVREKGLSHQAVHGLLWTAWGKGAQAVLQLAVVAVLARLVSPREFGIVSAALIVIGFSAIFSRAGLGPALVQRRVLEERHIATAFVASIVLGALVGAVLWLCAPAVAHLFRMDGTEPILRALALAFPIKGAGVVAEALYERELRFRWLANLEVVSFALGYGVIGVVCAALGLGAWALVAASLGEALLKAGILVVARRPPARLYVDRAALRELVHFGGGFTAGRYFNYLALQGDNLVVGRFLGAVALGLYGRAYQLMASPAALFGDVLDKVLFPAMARVQDDQARLAAIYRRGVTLIALIMLPLSALLYVLAPELIRIALGSRWDPVVAPFQIFAIGMLFRTSYKMSDAIARATGNVYRRALRQVLYAGLVIGGAIVGQRWGIAGVAVGVLFALAANFASMAQLSLRVTRISWAQFAVAHFPALRLAAVTLAIVWPLAPALRLWGLSALPLVSACIGVTLVLVLPALRFFPTLLLGRDGLWMLDLLRTYISKRGAVAPPLSPDPIKPADVSDVRALA